jgi:predicted nicotinamide N-methyase
MNTPHSLQQALHDLLGDARLRATPLPGTDLRLWLIDADNMDRAFSPEETRRILEEPPYWCFCWASGLALARYLAANPEWIAGKRVLDFGAGSGVAAIAAVKAGALEVKTSGAECQELAGFVKHHGRAVITRRRYL